MLDKIKSEKQRYGKKNKYLKSVGTLLICTLLYILLDLLQEQEYNLLKIITKATVFSAVMMCILYNPFL